MQLRFLKLIPSHRRRGFSFVELLFAVLILGIGLIMIAAIFPVGLSQTKSNFDETQSAAIGRSAVGQIENVATKTDFPNNLDVVAMQKAPNPSILPNIAARSMINVADARYAWVGMYYRPLASTAYAQVMFFLVARSDPYTVLNDLQAAAPVQFLTPRPVLTTLNSGSITIAADNTVVQDGSNPNAAAPGAFIVIRGYSPTVAAAASDMSVSVKNNVTNAVTTPPPTAADVSQAQLNVTGLCFRIGAINGGAYGFFPGNEFKPVVFSWIDTAANTTHTVTVNSMSSARGFIIGRNRIATVGASTDFDGPVQDVAYYTSFVLLK